jgi:predicted Zn-dependent protease
MKHTALLVLALCLVCPAFAQAQLPSLGDLGNAIQKVKKTADDTARVAKGASGLSLAEEVAIGDAVAVAIVTRYGGIWRDEAATRRVNLVGLILAQYALRQDLQWRFGLLDSDAINAFSAPGGRVFITRGLYQLPLSDAGLAGVLAHEIIHIDQRHAIGIIARGEFWGGVTDLVADNNANYAAFEAAVGDTENLILDEGFDSGKEYEADAGGRELALVTGYPPGGLRAVLMTIDSAQEGSEEVFSTHPSTEARLKRLPGDPLP